MTDNRNFVAFLIASLLVIFTYDILFLAPERARQADQAVETADPAAPPQPQAPALDQPAPAQTVPAAEVPRLSIDTPALAGSIALRGGYIDDLFLKTYKTSIEEDAERIHLLHPVSAANAYYANVSWLALGDSAGALPYEDTVWTADAETLTAEQPVTLSWTNAAGLTFEREIAVDENFLFTVTQRVINRSGETVSLAPYAFIRRRTKPQTTGFFILHEGPVGVLNEQLFEIGYGEVEDEDSIAKDSTGGWVGITDKYWLVAVAPDGAAPIKARFVHTEPGGIDQYQTDFLGETQALAPGDQAEAVTRLFAGAKDVGLLRYYEREYGIDGLDRSVDWGWFWFLTRPFFFLLHWIQGVVGNVGVAILILTVLVKAAFYPLASKSFHSMARMKKLQPKMKALQERYKDDRQRLSQELMTLYKEEKVNPAAGCLPVLIQIPVFFALYKVLFVTIEMRHQPFFGWIQDLSAPDPATILTLFGFVDWDVPAILSLFNIGIWPILMGITTYLQFRLNPAQMDPVQQKIFAFMPLFMVFVVASFPAGLVIYWTWNTVLTALQQWLIIRNSDEAPARKKKTV